MTHSFQILQMILKMEINLGVSINASPSSRHNQPELNIVCIDPHYLFRDYNNRIQIFSLLSQETGFGAILEKDFWPPLLPPPPRHKNMYKMFILRNKRTFFFFLIVLLCSQVRIGCGPTLRLRYAALRYGQDTRTCAAAMVHLAAEDVRLVKVRFSARSWHG